MKNRPQWADHSVTTSLFCSIIYYHCIMIEYKAIIVVCCDVDKYYYQDIVFVHISCREQ
jgi:hypothetical protein